ncbi:MAG: hypothetical protein ABIP48_10765 [Planctomycetota bacterium]
MKNQYFGDINDYRKYGLLRALQRGGTRKLLVAWMLTPDDGGRDGGFRDYLQQPGRWRRFDAELYDGLRALLQAAPTPQVSLIESSSLLPSTSYYSELVPGAREDRDAWRTGLLHAACGTDLVFLDPDNGIEVSSRPIGRKGSSKYVAWKEIEEIWDAGCSLLIYQHFRREPREAFADRMVTQLRKRTGAPFTRAFRTAHVLFLLAAQARHETSLGKAMSCSLPAWQGQIDIMGLANGAGFGGSCDTTRSHNGAQPGNA